MRVIRPELFLLCVIAAIATAQAKSNTVTETTAAETEHDDSASVESEQRVAERQTRGDDLGYRLTPIIEQLTQKVTQLEAQVQALQGSQQGNGDTGTVYTRWGEKSCPGSAELVYSGSIGGSNYVHAGAAVNYLCLPPNPVYDNHTLPTYHAYVYGAEYETYPESTHNLEPTCAVCRVPRATSLLLPATDVCPPGGWTREYSGYLMANYYAEPAASEYVCVDSAFGYLPGTQADSGGKTLFYTVFQCGSLSCPPYVQNKVVLCAVCTK